MLSQTQVLPLRQIESLDAVASGGTPEDAALRLGISVPTVCRRLDDARVAMQVVGSSLRTLIYTYEVHHGAGRPELNPPSEIPDLDPLTTLIWAGLRLDVPDRLLVPELAALAEVDAAEVTAVLDQLTEQYHVPPHGLIRIGLHAGVLSGKEGTLPCYAQRRRDPSGGPWNLGATRFRVLELRAAGLSVIGCAQRTGMVQAAVYAHLRECARHAGVEAQRSLVHEAVRAGILIPPASAGPGGVPLSGALAAVWRGMVLDVPDRHLVGAISRQTGLPAREVDRHLRHLRSMGMPDCRLVLAGWEAGVLDEQAKIVAPVPELSLQGGAGAPARAHKASDPMKLTGQEVWALGLVAVEGLTIPDAAKHMGITPHTAQEYLRNCRRAAGTSSVLTAIHKACLARLLNPFPLDPARTWEVADDVRAVWRALVLDTPEKRLVRDIAAVAGLSTDRVEECLDELHSTGLTSAQLIVEGWAHQVLDSEARLTPPRLLIPSADVPVPRHAVRPDRDDPLGLLPAGQAAGPLRSGAGGLVGNQVAGVSYDFVRVAPETCRALLEQTAADRWGPVLGLPDAGAALLVTAAGADGLGRRGAVGRLSARGRVVRLPEDGHCTTPDGAYWAAPADRPLWDHGLIAHLLNPHEPRLPGSCLSTHLADGRAGSLICRATPVVTPDAPGPPASRPAIHTGPDVLTDATPQ
ncbi:hypothetical protein [Streptomyces sp. NPDC052042]|uniref:hypothetical protein n=1 Tax=Streptomyces sp. NPDC052042 TaxID=3365683 RepID=UPI0037D093CF